MFIHVFTFGRDWDHSPLQASLWRHGRRSAASSETSHTAAAWPGGDRIIAPSLFRNL